MIICVGSKNKVKIAAVSSVIAALKWEDSSVVGYDVPSGVSLQPRNDDETMQGAINRAHAALETGKGDIGIGLEGGVHETKHGMYLCNWGAAVDRNGFLGIGGGARILLPSYVADAIRQGQELGHVMNGLLQRNNVSTNEGAIGVFTNGFITRDKMFSDVVACALAPYHNQFYKG